ncbi:FAD-binding oxidoreductase [Planktomarina sp.]|nr:FAD-binding oxidoreductase [Planktomarina sp.]MDA9253226.1 FAD-binding oxidoreductase [Planktomarina sp.]
MVLSSTTRGQHFNKEIWSQDYKETSYWLEGLSPLAEVVETPPRNVDVAIVGSGYTGLNAALQTSRGGRSTLVLEAGDPGFGCSTKNGGQVSTSIKPSLEKLSTKFGREKGLAIRKEGENALDWIEEFVSSEKIDCSFSRSGRYHAAHTPKHYELITRDAEKLGRSEGIEAYAVPSSEQLKELGSEVYHGGVVFPRHASLDPGKYHRGILQRVVEAGVDVVGNCAVMDIEKVADGFVLRTPKGEVKARDVIVATNGYTTKLTPWLQRRVIPIGSYIIATEKLDPSLVETLFPTNRIASDTCKVVYYYRTSPDRQRILFGGRVSATETNPMASGPKLLKDMYRIFPQLEGTKISHSWTGTVAYTFDELAHTGQHNGIYYSMGYCGSGVSMASYLGMRLGQKVLKLAEGKTAFDDLPFPTRPLYSGKPWFLPAVVSWYRFQDWRQYQSYTNRKLA